MYQVVLQDCIRIPDDHTTGNDFKYDLLGSATYLNVASNQERTINVAHRYYVVDADLSKISTLDTQLTS